MRKPRILFLIIALIVASGFLPYPESVLSWTRARAGQRILMIGNSFTFGEDMPRLLETLLANANAPAEIQVVAPGGRYLEWHSENPITLAVLNESQWDLVILQDCSTCPLDYKRLFARGVRKMVKLVKEVGAIPLLFMTWADKGKESDLEIISAEYLRMGKELGVEVVPVGEVWDATLKKDSSIPLHADDSHHASKIGALLTAYVFAFFLTQDKTIDTLRIFPENHRFLYQAILAAKEYEINGRINKLIWEQSRIAVFSDVRN